MPNYKLTLEYDGTNLLGWQRQKEGDTGQSVLESAIAKLFDEVPKIVASGRTDTGVHAYGQVINFISYKEFSEYTLTRALNFHLVNKPLVVIKTEIAADDFSARYSAKKRYYQYKILNRPSRSVVNEGKSWHIQRPLDVKAMNKAASFLMGDHDFTSFRASQCQANSALKTIDNINIFRESEEVLINVSARSFLHHMVRNFVGTLVEVGIAKISPEEVKNILEAKDRKVAKQTAPACGLYFVRVEY